MRPATACTSRARGSSIRARRSARRSAWPCTSRKAASGKTRSRAAGPSGGTSSRASGRRFPGSSARLPRTSSTSRSTPSSRRSSGWMPTRSPTICTSSCGSSWRNGCWPGRWRWRTCPRRGTPSRRNCSASRLPTTAKACCRTCTGRAACSATFRATASAT